MAASVRANGFAAWLALLLGRQAEAMRWAAKVHAAMLASGFLSMAVRRLRRRPPERGAGLPRCPMNFDAKIGF